MLGVTGGYNLNLANVENLVGSAGNDFVTLTTNQAGLNVDLGGGSDNLNLANGTNSVSVTNVENVAGSDFAPGSVSNDTLTLLDDVSGVTVNLGNGSNTLNLAAGANSLVDIFNVQHVNGTASNDTLTVTDTIYEPGGNPIVDLGAGFDVLNFGSQYETLTALNIEQLNGNALDNGFALNNDVNGIADRPRRWQRQPHLGGRRQLLSVSNVENLNTNDFSGPAVDDTVTLQNDVSGLSVNLAQGDNTLNLAAGSNSFVDLFNVQHINGTASDDVLTVTDGVVHSGQQPGHRPRRRRQHAELRRPEPVADGAEHPAH